ncbi:hypothetical protein [Listeria sp. ILCC792]|uniref:hypothetical protein n=1 Tax=Listeria sp. ILCC792 TaxID=1918331 RepID=UPI000B58B446|nr:hypothetical protein [Listeria sp. ILCC792]
MDIQNKFLSLFVKIDKLNIDYKNNLIPENEIRDIKNYWEDFDEDIKIALKHIDSISDDGKKSLDGNLTELLLLRANLIDLTRYFEDARMLIENVCIKIDEEENKTHLE